MRDEGVGVSMRDTFHSKEVTRVSVVPGQGGLRVASSGFGLQAAVGWAVSSGGLQIDFCWAYSLVGAGGPRMAVLGRASESPTGLHASGLFISLGRQRFEAIFMTMSLLFLHSDSHDNAFVIPPLAHCL
ncbi:hypothetical protein SDJN03_23936, partial [Cucurbita argyrosperma subsp. sororia]